MGPPLDYDPATRNDFVKLVLSLVLLMLVVTAGFLAFVLTTPSVKDFFRTSGWTLSLFAIMMLLGLNYAIVCSPCTRYPPGNFLLLILTFDFTSWMLYVVVIGTAFSVIAMIVLLTMLVTGTVMKPLILVILIVGTLIEVIMLTIQLQTILGGRSVELSENDYALVSETYPRDFCDKPRREDSEELRRKAFKMYKKYLEQKKEEDRCPPYIYVCPQRHKECAYGQESSCYDSTFNIFLVIVFMILSVMLACTTGFIYVVLHTKKYLHVRYGPIQFFALIVCAVMNVLILVIELQLILGGRSMDLDESDYAIGAFLLYTAIIELCLSLVQATGILEDNDVC
ncbi:unnamed protein product, partial [Iphiclides podalirius]